MRRLVAGILMFLACGLICSACGKEEDWKLGVDGYVYIAQESELTSAVGKDGKDFLVVDDSFYFIKGKSICRIDLSAGEVDSVREVVSTKGSSCCYTADGEGNIYYVEAVFPGGTDDRLYTLHKLDREGTLLFGTDLGNAAYVGQDCLAVDKEGIIYVLCGDQVQLYNADARLCGNIPIGDYAADESQFPGHFLMKDEKGSILCVVNDGRRTVLELSPEGGGKTAVVDALGGSVAEQLFMTSEGLLVNLVNGLVYSWRLEENGNLVRELVLRWQDSDRMGGFLFDLVSLPGGDLFMKDDYNEPPSELKKTAVDELPERELVVLASLNPSQDLIEAVTDFNRQSSQYRVSLENFGGGLAYDPGAADHDRMDASLVSSTPPDLLDLADLDVVKYAGKGVLSDLEELLGEETVSAYSDNVVEAYTIGGRLVCIPTAFELHTVACRRHDAGLLADGYDSGILMRAVEELSAAGRGTAIRGGWRSRNFFLDTFFARECLIKYIDWENGTSSFGAGDFGKLLEWVRSCPRMDMIIDSRVPDEVFLTDCEMRDFLDILILEESLGEEPALVGYPTPDSGPYHMAEPVDGLGIVEKSRHKEGAARFLEYYLTRDISGENWDMSRGFPTRREALEAQVRAAEKGGAVSMTIRNVEGYDEEVLLSYKDRWNGLLDILLNAIRTAHFVIYTDAQLNALSILQEEAEYYFMDQKPLDEVLEVMDNRITVLVQEEKY